MSIGSRQRDRALTLALEEILKKGKPFQEAQIIERVRQFLPFVLGEPSFRLREQPNRGKFHVDWQNNMFKEAEVDLDLLYDENVSIIETVLAHLALAETTGRRYGQEIRALQGLLDDMLLTSTKATPFFFSLFDSFTDLSKVDQTRSDVALDPSGGLVSLAPTASTSRIKLSHLRNRNVPALQVILPRGATNRLVPGSSFSNIADDLLTAWQHQILSESQDGLSLRFLVPLVPEGESAVEISRIQLHPLSPTPFQILPTWSNDGIAFTRFLGVEPQLTTTDVVTFDVPPTRAKVIQFEITKTSPDGEDEIVGDLVIPGGQPRPPGVRTRRFSYLIGFRQISFWKMGYKRTGTYVSKVLTPQDSDNLRSIGKVSLTTDEFLPEGTEIRYEVSGDQSPELFIPISPINRQNPDAPNVVDFSKSQRSGREDNRFTIDNTDTPTSLGTIRGTEYFSIRTISDPTVFQTVRLWRGLNAWTAKRNETCEIKSVQNLYIDFKDSDVQRLYTFENTERIAVHGANTDGTTALDLTVRFPILLSSDTFNPSQDVRLPTDVTKPDYAVAQLIRRPPEGSLRSDVAAGTVTFTSRSGSTAATGNASQQTSPTAGRAGAQMVVANFTGSGLLAPLANDEAGEMPDLVGQNIRVSYVVNSQTIDGTFTITSANINASGGLEMALDDPTEKIKTASITSPTSSTWEILAVNITRSITGVNGNTIMIDRSQRIGATDLLEVTYRRALLPSETPLTASFTVTRSTGNDNQFEEGTDFTIDLATRTIARIPTGNIQRSQDAASLSVRVSYDYEARTIGMVTYRTFLFNSEAVSKTKLTKITVDTVNGEQALFETSSGFLDLNDREELPELGTGWHQIVVLSDPVFKDDGTINTTSAIYKLINLATEAGKLILPASSHPNGDTLTGRFAGFFTRQTAFLSPMTQMTFRQFSTNTRRTDRTVFAVKAAAEAPATSDPVVAVNFDPRDSDDLLYFPPDLTGSNLPLDREDFELDYAFIPTSVAALTGITLRATLTRDAQFDGSISPFLKSYNIRVSY